MNFQIIYNENKLRKKLILSILVPSNKNYSLYTKIFIKRKKYHQKSNKKQNRY